MRAILADPTPAELLRTLGVRSHAADVVATALTLLGLVGAGATLILKQIGRLRSWIHHLRASEEERLRLRARSLFAQHVDRRIRDLDHRDEWSDHRFAELEAEVETLGLTKPDRQFGRSPSWDGLRRERSLTKALRKRSDQLILLQGDPGSGKSVALRFIATQMSEHASKTTHGEAVIPLYINLKALIANPGNVTAEVIEDFVLAQLRDGADRDTHEFLAEEFSRGKQQGTWFFLFDSFDEIPAVLSATEENEVVRAYSDAIFAFMHGMNRCRGVIASRAFRAPPRYGLPRFRIVPLNEQRKRELIKLAGLSSAEVKLAIEMPGTTPDVVALSSNPLFLGLLCDYVRDMNALPDGWHDVFEAYVSRRIATDAPKMLALFGIDEDELRRRSEEIAFTMTVTPDLGLSPTRSRLLSAHAEAGFSTAGRMSIVLDALQWSKLARSEDGAVASVDPTFTFAHRRFQEYFATSVVLRDPLRVPAYELLTNESWRETAVTLIQTHRDQVARLVGAADELLVAALESMEDRTVAFAWPSGVLHVLGLLQSGFAGNADDLPAPLRRRVSMIVEDASSRGTIRDRKWALEVAGPAPSDSFARLIWEALNGQSKWLRDAAFRQAARLAEVSDRLALDIRNALLYRAANWELQREWLATRTQILRLRPSKPLLDAARLLRVSPLVDCAFVVGACVISCVIARSHGAVAAFAGIALLAVGTYPGTMRLIAWYGDINLRKGFIRLARAAPGMRAPKSGTSSASSVPGLVALQCGLFARALIPASAATGAAALPVAVGCAVLTLYMVTWGLAAAWASVYTAPPPLMWPFVHASVVQEAIVRAQVTWIRPVLSWVRRGARLVVVVLVGSLLVRVGVVGDVFAILGLIALVAAAVGVGVTLLRGKVRDRLWLWKWSLKAPARLSSEELLDALGGLRTGTAIAALLRQIRLRSLLRREGDTALTVEDLLRLVEGGGVDDWRSPSMRAWIVRADRQTVALLAEGATTVLDELGQLLEELAHGAQLPSA